MSKKVFVTRAGREVLEKKRTELMQNLAHVQGQKGEAAEIGGNAWHDNFAFEDLERQEKMLNRQIKDANDVLNSAVVVSDEPQGTEVLQIGHVAELYIEDDDATKVVIVGGYGESDLKANPPVIDYSAPLLEPFFGHNEGYEASVRLAGMAKTVILEKIKMKE